jgi:hypothetical protein
LVLIKNEKHLLFKGTTKRMKITTDWKTTFASHLSGKGFVSCISKELSEFNNKETDNLVKMGKIFR